MKLKHFDLKLTKKIKGLVHKVPRLILISLGVIAIPMVLFAIGLLKPTKAAAWFDDAWSYRRAIPVTNNTTAETNVYIAVAIDTTDTTMFQADCGDIRFTSQNGDLLPYFIHSPACGQSNTDLHVELKVFPAGAQTIYLYYGNPSAPNGFNVANFSTAASNYSVGTLGSQEKSLAPVAYWKFDEGNGDTTTDSMTNKLVGTLSGVPLPTWQTEDMCVSGKCLFFTGSSEVASSTQVNNIKSVSFWIRPKTNQETMISLSAAFTHYIDSYEGTIETPGITSPEVYVNGVHTSAVTANVWQQITITIDEAIDGIPIIGYAPAAEAGFNGFIDDVKLYNYVLSEAQIKADYNAKAAGLANGGKTILGAQNNDALNQGLVGYWKMDEGSWDGSTGEVLDASGNGNTGTANGSATTGAGKYGKGGIFTSDGQYVEVNTTMFQSNAFTVSSWVKPDSSCLAPTSLCGFLGNAQWSGIGGHGYHIGWDSGGNMDAMIEEPGGGGSVTVPTSNFAADTWAHVAMVFDGSYISVYVNGVLKGGPTAATKPTAASNNLRLGKDPQGGWTSPEFHGSLDETRVYNRALSPTEISQLYNFAPTAAAKYTLDEHQGSVVSDTSGNNNNGTLQTGIFSALAPSWAIGKYGYGLSFNGVDNYFTAPSSTSLNQSGSFSLSAYIKPSGDGTILSKGNNYKLALDEGRTTFTTKGITTQLSGTAITSVYFYDTTKDAHYGDGTSADPLVWRFNSSKSWYSETIDHPYSTCSVSSDDRCGTKEFPEKAYIVATLHTLYIFDAQENALWMKFNEGGTVGEDNLAILGDSNSAVSSVDALNGKVYFSKSETNYGYAASINFIGDAASAYRYSGSCTSVAGLYNGNISQRNSTLGFQYNAGQCGAPSQYLITHNDVKDIHAAVTGGKTYVALATASNVSVINETDGTVINFINSWDDGYYSYVHKVFIAGNDLYAVFGNTDTPLGLYAWYNFATNWSSGVSKSFFDPTAYNANYGAYGYDNSSPPTLTPNNLSGGYLFSRIESIFVTPGTSTVDGHSNTIYLGFGVYNAWSGLTVLQEKQGDETKGSVKYFTKDYITEEMVGDIQGMWPFNGTGALANNTDISDASIKGTTLTASNTNGTGMTYAAGVRGSGITFDGTDDYLKQKVYMNQTGASFGPTVHGLSLATGQAFYKAQGVDISNYKGTDGSSTPYMLVLKDSANKTAWGYVGSQDAAEALGSELTTDGDMEAVGRADWSDYVSPATVEKNTTSPLSGSQDLHIITDNAGWEGVYQQIGTLTAGKLYKASVTYKVTSVNFSVAIGPGGFSYWPAFNKTDATKTTSTIYFTATATGTNQIYIMASSASEFYVDDVTVKEVTDVGTTGVHILSTRNGSTRNWAGIESGFNYNDSSYTFEVRKADFQITGNISLGLWIKGANPGNYQIGILCKSHTSDGSWCLETVSGSGGKIMFNKGGIWSAGSSHAVVFDNTWHHLVVTANGTTVYYYVDGVLDTTYSQPSAFLDSSSNFQIGLSKYSAYLNATIDEPFVTASVLTAGEIQRMYEVGKRALTAGGTNTLNGSSSHVNSAVAGGLTKTTSSSATNTNARLFAGTDGGGVSEIDLSSDTLVNYYTNVTTPAINSATVNSLSYTSDGNFIAGLSSGVSRLNGVSGKSNVTVGQWSNVVGEFDKNSGYYNLYENGILVGKTNVGISHTPQTNSNLLSVGTSHTSNSTYATYPLSGSIDQVEIYAYPLTTANQNSIVATPKESKLGGLPGTSTSPVGYWKFDEGTGNVANNSGSGGSAYNGTITNPSWTTNGKFGKALYFGGSSFVDMGSLGGLSGNSETVSFWAKTDSYVDFAPFVDSSFGGSTSTLRFAIGYYYSGAPYFTVFLGDGSSYDYVDFHYTIPLGVWKHYAVALDGTTIKLYIDGVLYSTKTVSHTLAAGDYTVGRGFGGVAQIHGSVDEVKVYNYPLTTEEVKTEYNHGTSITLGATSDTSGISGGTKIDNSAGAKYCVPGDTASCAAPVGEWSFDEGSGGTVKDISGSGNNGTWYGSGSHWTTGKYGNAANFTKDDDYVDLGTLNMVGGTSATTVSMWVRMDIDCMDTSSSFKYLFAGIGGQHNIWYQTAYNGHCGNFVDQMFASGSSSSFYANWDTTPFVKGSWHHLAVSYDGSKRIFYWDGKNVAEDTNATGTINSNSSTSTISTSLSDWQFTGAIDDVRIYDYTRTPAQIAWDYNKGAPVVWYKMDECQGTVLHSTNEDYNSNLNGTLNLGAAGVTAPGTCKDGTGTTAWSKGAIGKFGASLSFDGTDDYVSTGNFSRPISGNFTVSAWVKPTSFSTTPDIFSSRIDCGSGGNTFDFGTYSTGKIHGDIGTGSSWLNTSADATTFTLSTGNWYHIVYVVTTTGYTIYANGAVVGSGVYSASTPLLTNGSSCNALIGAEDTANAQSFNGQIDDVQIFNYALTATQIKTLFNQGFAVKF